jgi:hypothetical protein
MKKVIIAMSLVSIVAFAKDYNPTCKEYEKKVIQQQNLSVEVEALKEKLDNMDNARYNRGNKKAVKKEYKAKKKEHKTVKNLVDQASKSLDKRINYLANNFDNAINFTSAQIIEKCDNPEYKNLEFSKILMKSVVPATVIVEPNPDADALAACMSKLENIQGRLAANIDDSGTALDEIRGILDLVESEPDETEKDITEK